MDLKEQEKKKKKHAQIKSWIIQRFLYIRNFLVWKLTLMVS